MPHLTFSGGVHPLGHKSITKDSHIRQARVPARVVLPLSQHTGKPSNPTVKPGDYVEAGAKIADAVGFISSCLHSSISGIVKSIEQASHPVFGKFLSIIIESDGKQKQRAGILQDAPASKIEGLSPEGIIQAVSDAGVVGMGGAGFPTHVKLSPPKGKRIGALIINGAECEPYLTCDHRLMLERPEDIIKGAMIMAKALGVKEIITGIEDNKPDAIAAMRKANAPRVISLRARYPQGAEKQLIKTLLGREVPSGGLPFDVGAVVQNVATSLAVYEAVMLNKPLYERVVTISGDCIKEPANLLVKIGTTVRDLAAECGGFVREPKKVIFGGPMMGTAQWTLDVPVLKGTSGVLFLGEEAAGPKKEGVCIRCGGCVRVCPEGLSPTNIYYAAAKSRFDLAGEYNCLDCVECGACTFECPAKLELTAMIKYAKLMAKR